MPLTDPIRLFQATVRHRHGPTLFRAALAVQMASLRLQLALSAAVLRWCPPLHPWGHRRAVALTATARRIRLQLQYLLSET